MVYEKSDFTPFSSDAQRISANFEQIYKAWLNARRQFDELPVSKYWVAKDSTDYLYVKSSSIDNGASVGPRGPNTEKQLSEFTQTKEELKMRIQSFDAVIQKRAGLYRRLRLPSLPDKFDLAWCRGSKVSLATLLGNPPANAKTLFGVLKSMDSSYRISPRKPCQAVSSDGYEVELLAAPSTHPLPKNEAFDPMTSLIEQEWLLKGTAVSVVVATLRGRAAPLVVPDPRWMALHKLWLADKPERRADKKGKDRRQANVLLDATRYFLENSHPLNIDFLMELPEQLRSHFGQWCASSGFIPAQ